MGFEVSENNNEIDVSGASPMQNIDFEVSVRNFSLKLYTVNGGIIRVENIEGEMELSNVNGDITLRNMGGSALVNTVNGEIEASFESVTSDKPMAFSNLNGDIEVTLPANTRMEAKMKSEWSEIFTDFEMDIRRENKENVNSSTQVDNFRILSTTGFTGVLTEAGQNIFLKVCAAIFTSGNNKSVMKTEVTRLSISASSRIFTIHFETIPKIQRIL